MVRAFLSLSLSLYLSIKRRPGGVLLLRVSLSAGAGGVRAPRCGCRVAFSQKRFKAGCICPAQTS